MVEARGLTKSFPGGPRWSRLPRIEAVRGVDLRVATGSIYGLVGESGSGKTTLARTLLFLDPPTAGTVTVAGTRLNDLTSGQLRRFRSTAQLVLQDPASALDPRMRAGASIRLGLRQSGLSLRKQQERVVELAELVGMSPDRLVRYPHQLSGGQRQRVVIARALAVEPQLLVLDEPVSKLDVSIQAQIVNLLLDIRTKLGLTYLFISHDLHLVGYLSDYIGVMYRGRIVECAPAAALLAGPRHPYTRHLFASVPTANDELKKLRGRVETSGTGPALDAPAEASMVQVGPDHFVLSGASEVPA